MNFSSYLFDGFSGLFFCWGEKVVAAKMILLVRKRNWQEAKIISVQMSLALFLLQDHLFLYLYKDSLNQKFTKA